jgi:hypothetical protein
MASDIIIIHESFRENLNDMLSSAKQYQEQQKESHAFVCNMSNVFVWM